jgi:hypothetical protein
MAFPFKPSSATEHRGLATNGERRLELHGLPTCGRPALRLAEVGCPRYPLDYHRPGRHTLGRHRFRGQTSQDGRRGASRE